MKGITRLIDNYGTTRLFPALMLLCASGLAMAAVFTPWLRWSQPPGWAGSSAYVSTSDLNYVLPFVADMGTRDIIGAQARDGGTALWVGYGARLIVLGITASSFLLLVRNRALRYQVIISVLVLPIFFAACALIGLCNAVIDEVYVADEAALPHIVGVEWSGPALLAGAVVLFALALWSSRQVIRIKIDGAQDR